MRVSMESRLIGNWERSSVVLRHCIDALLALPGAGAPPSAYVAVSYGMRIENDVSLFDHSALCGCHVDRDTIINWRDGVC